MNLNYRSMSLGCLLSVLALPAVAQTPSAYIVMERTPDGSLVEHYSLVVETEAARPSLSNGDIDQLLQRRSRDKDRLRIRLRDRQNRIVHQDVASVPTWLRGEFHKEQTVTPGESNIDATLVPLESSAFVIRVPLIEGASLEIGDEDGVPQASFSLEGMQNRARVAAATAPPPLPGWDNGDPANRVDLLLIGEGYTAAEEATFEADVTLLLDSFFDITPYDDYRNYVNVTKLHLASAESGADQPPYDPGCAEYARVQSCCSDPGSSGAGAVSVSTALDATYCSYSTQRLLTVDVLKALIAAGAAPGWDEIIVLVNAPEYGGSGGIIGVVSTNSFAVDVARHEYGHSFTQLADEYTTAYPGYPPCSDVNASVTDNCERNVTNETTRDLLKWKRWIDPSMSVPSFGPPPSATDAGLWQGARYLSSGMYRQGHNCLMRSLGRPFCDVDGEAYALRLYEGGWGIPAGGIDGVEPGSEQPAPGPVALPAGTTASFRAQVLGPVSGPDPLVNWYVDGALVSSNPVTSGADATLDLVNAAGLFTVTLEVVDQSPILHSDVRDSLASVRHWNVSAQPECPASIDTGCLSPFAKGMLLINEEVGREKLIVKLGGGPAMDQPTMGNPLAAGGTIYNLCIYDQEKLVADLVVDRAGDDCSASPCWQSIGKAPPNGKGYRYKDGDGAAHGIQKLVYKSGEAGKSKVIVKGKGSTLPTDVADQLQDATVATVQVRAHDGQCLSVDLDDIKKQESAFFKAKR